MAGDRDPREMERIAAEVGVTAAQVAAVLQAAGRAPAPAGGPAATVIPSVHPPASAAGPAPSGPRAAAPFPDAAAWAATGVALVAMFVFVASTAGFNEQPQGKGAALATGAVAIAIALRAALESRRRRHRLGEQLGLSVAALVSPLVAWSGLWLLGLWPGEWVQAPPAAGHEYRYWDSGDDAAVARALLFVFLTPMLAGAWALRRTGAGLALGIALLAAHGVLAALGVIAGIPRPGDVLLTVLTGGYSAAFGWAAWRLESGRSEWATWVHPFSLGGAYLFVASTAVAFGSAAGLLVGGLLVVAGALLTVALGRGIHLAAVILGGAAWDFWLYGELDLGPVAGLALTLALGLGTVALGVSVWRRRGGGVAGRSPAT